MVEDDPRAWRPRDETGQLDELSAADAGVERHASRAELYEPFLEGSGCKRPRRLVLQQAPHSHEQRQHLKVVEHRGESGWVVDGGRGDDPDELWPLPGVGKCLNPACLVDTVLRSCLHEHRRTDARVFGVGGKVTLRHRRFLVEPRIPPQPCVPHVAVGVDDARHGDHRVAQ